MMVSYSRAVEARLVGWVLQRGVARFHPSPVLVRAEYVTKVGHCVTPGFIP